MIVTLTLNPSLDRTLEVDTLERGAVLRAASVHLDPGGKGVNVARALLANGVATRAVIPCGGPEGEQLVRLLAEEGVIKKKKKN
jgi:1-phosphofructokinase